MCCCDPCSMTSCCNCCCTRYCNICPPENPGPYTISGTVTGTNGQPAVNFPIQYTVSGSDYAMATDTTGTYAFAVNYNDSVTITVSAGVGVTVSPAQYIFVAAGDYYNYNFTLSSLVY